MIGDIIVKLDTLRASLPAGSPWRKKMDDIRRLLNEKQIELAKLVFDEGTTAYQAATGQLTVITGNIKVCIDDVDETAQTFSLLEKLVTSINSLFSLAKGCA
jgi:hypothetical protein